MNANITFWLLLDCVYTYILIHIVYIYIYINDVFNILILVNNKNSCIKHFKPTRQKKTKKAPLSH